MTTGTRVAVATVFAVAIVGAAVIAFRSQRDERLSRPPPPIRRTQVRL